ncbi:MAG: hypothetical protein HYZ79_00070 [Candidatus Melainabacteria bacterium]|nr:hypothetical protein [Candidatus Melainabacteria bacterium]
MSGGSSKISGVGKIPEPGPLSPKKGKAPAGSTPPVTDDLSPKITQALKLTENYLVAPTCFLSLGTGALSFLLHNVFKNSNEFVCKVAEYASKAAVFSTSVFGSLRNAYNKDSFGTLAFSVDFLTSIFARGDNLYLLKGFGSGLDHTPLLLTDVATNPKIVKEYNLEKGNEDAFNQYTGFLDSAKKTFSAVRVIFSDIYDEFKSKGFQKGFIDSFFKGERTAEKNLLVSGLGIIGGASVAFIPGLHILGASLRDLFGIYADLSYYDKGMSEASGKLDSQSKKHYRKSGIEYTVGSVLDLLYRWTKIEGLNLLALGVDRWGACDAVKGIVREIEEKRKLKPGKLVSSPQIQPQGLPQIQPA